jgi:exonuclease SbcC
MRPIKLSMRAFGPYADEETVDFRELRGRSFFLIHGPTGSGKTAILDAICFALYGKTSGAERDGSDMRSHYADDTVPTVVVFDFAVGQKEYRVQRSPSYEVAGRKTPIGPDATLWDRTDVRDEDDASCEGRVIETGVRAVTARVEEILGFQADQFRQVVLLPQGQFRQALTADSAERREIMEILFGTEPYRLVEAALKEEAKSLESKLEQGRDRSYTLLKQASEAREFIRIGLCEGIHHRCVGE